MLELEITNPYALDRTYDRVKGEKMGALDGKAVSLIGKNVTAVQGDVSKLDDVSTKRFERSSDASILSSRTRAS